MNGEIKVSIYCLAYNHEKYIRDALKGFVMQKTNFAYEVIIHDDASTDGTATIIKEYQKLYPHIIKPVFQEENQYSKGIDIFDTYLYEKMKGKYIAVCEGDDFWTSENKLQRQVDILEKHEEYSACTHSVEEFDCRYRTRKVFNPTNEDYVFDLKDLLQWGGKRYLTPSLVARKELFAIPRQIKMEKVGDYPRAIYLALNGPIYYMKDVMAVYRYYAQGSWTSGHVGGNKKSIEMINARTDFLRRLDDYTNGQHRKIIEQVISGNELEKCLLSGNYSNVFEKLLSVQDKRLRLRVCANLFFPHICKIRRQMLKKE